MRIKANNPYSIELVKVRQVFDNYKLSSIEDELNTQLEKLSSKVNPGMSIAITAGSRGINNIDRITRQVVEWIKGKGANPFIIPAMGSHGGATDEGQKSVLNNYGIDEQMMGCPVKSSMDVVELEKKSSPIPVYMDEFAYKSDGVILINRIKPHTNFHGDYESGLVKMATIGLGKHAQAFAIHTYGTKGMVDYMPAAAKDVFASGKIIGGVGIIENAYDETCHIEVLETQDILKQEPALLKKAKEVMPSLPVKEIDVLIVDRIGKNISGVGLDPNIIGRMGIYGQQNPDYPKINSIYSKDLTKETHGNALGMGLTDVISRTLYEKIDFNITYENVYTSGNYERVKIPVIADSDEQAIMYALRQNGETPAESAKIIRILDTLHLEYIYISQPVLDIIRKSSHIEIVGKPVKLLDSKGHMFNQ